MPTISPSWTENVALPVATPLAASGTDTQDIDLAALGADCVVLCFDLALGSSTAGIKVEVFESVDSGVNDTTAAIFEKTVSTDGRFTVRIFDSPYIAVQVTNLDTVTGTGAIGVTYAWRNWASV